LQVSCKWLTGGEINVEAGGKINFAGSPGTANPVLNVGTVASPLSYAAGGDYAAGVITNFTGDSGLFRGLFIDVANIAASTAGSLYGARVVADVEADTTMTDGNLVGVHGYARVMGTLDGAGLGGVRIAGLKGEVYSTGEPSMDCDFIAGVMAFATLDADPTTTNTYSAFLAYSASGAIYPDAMYAGYGRFEACIDTTGWNDTTDSLFWRAGPALGWVANTSNLGADTCIGVMNVELNGDPGYIPVLAAVPSG